MLSGLELGSRGGRREEGRRGRQSRKGEEGQRVAGGAEEEKEEERGRGGGRRRKRNWTEGQVHLHKQPLGFSVLPKLELVCARP